MTAGEGEGEDPDVGEAGGGQVQRPGWRWQELKPGRGRWAGHRHLQMRGGATSHQSLVCSSMSCSVGEVGVDFLDSNKTCP